MLNGNNSVKDFGSYNADKDGNITNDTTTVIYSMQSASERRDHYKITNSQLR